MRRQPSSRRVIPATSAIILAASTVPALAQSSPVSQTRSVYVEAFSEDIFQPPPAYEEAGESAPPGFAPWSASFSLEVATPGYQPTLATVAQNSLMTPGVVAADSIGEHCLPGGYHTCCGGAYADGTIDFSYTFRVRAATRYHLRGSTRSEYGAVDDHAFSHIEISTQRDTLFTHDSEAEEGPQFSASGELPPGEYTIGAGLWFDAGYTSYSAYGSASFQFILELAPPACPCDWDDDGVIGTSDFFAFVTDFFAGDADVNFDWSTNSQDFFDFLACFFAPPSGCA